MALDEEQKCLLADFVEADRRLPRERREGFIAIKDIIGKGTVDLRHEGFGEDGRQVSQNDLYELVSAGAIRVERRSPSVDKYWVTSRGRAMYEEHQRENGLPVARVERIVRDYLDSASFRDRHPRAFAKWGEAEAKLWAEDSEQNLTVVGHLCREAMQEFAVSLVRAVQVEDLPLDRNKTVDRLRAAIASRRGQRGDTDTAFDDALVVYWGTVSDMVQRQEHGSHRAGRPLTWNDARRLVLHLIVVMYEIDSGIG